MAENPKYKLYYRLMDLALLAGILGLLDFLGAHVFNLSFTQILNPEPPLGMVIAIGIGLLNFVLPVFLIVAYFLRDEYAEILWQRTATVMMYVVATTPGAIMMWAASHKVLTGQTSPLLKKYIFDRPTLDLVMTWWMVSALAFVAIFQFLRWQDSR